MTVTLRGWNARSAVAFVDGTRVRVRRTRTACRWACDVHGVKDTPHCSHLEAFAATPADPDLKSRHVR